MLQNTRCLAAPSLVITAICLSAPVVAQTPQTPPAPPPTATVLPTYRVNPGDVLEISVLGQPSLNKSVAIPPDGKIQYPYIGELNVAGLTLSEVTKQLKTGLSKEFTAPQVSVSMTKQRAFEVGVLGAVKSPGKHVMRDDYRLLDLIADCGGLAVARPEWASATLVRSGGSQAVKVNLPILMTTGNPEQNLVLSPGDVLLVEEVEATRVSAQILGEVQKPGSVVVPKDGSLATVITSVGGFTPSASLSHVTLMRNGKTLTLDLRQLLDTGKAVLTDTEGNAQETARVEPGDTIFVGKNRLSYSVVGAVHRPGTVDFPENVPVTVLSALNLAGGASGEADLKNISLVRPVPGGQPDIQTINVEELLKKPSGKGSKTPVRDVTLQPGDMLYLPQRGGAKHSFGIRDVLPALSIFNFINRF